MSPVFGVGAFIPESISGGQITPALALAKTQAFAQSRRDRWLAKSRTYIIATMPKEIAVLLIDHDMDLVSRFAQQISVLVQGSILVEGAPQDIAADPRVREIYLGDSKHGRPVAA